jgi:hypothetical protein
MCECRDDRAIFADLAAPRHQRLRRQDRGAVAARPCQGRRRRLEAFREAGVARFALPKDAVAFGWRPRSRTAEPPARRPSCSATCPYSHFVISGRETIHFDDGVFTAKRWPVTVWLRRRKTVGAVEAIMNLPSYAMNQASFPEMYERHLVGPLFQPWAEMTLEEIKLSPGDRVLDIACGTGIVARLAKERLGDDAYVVGVDLSPDMLAVARTVAPGIHWREGSASALPLRDEERFDVVVCQQGLQFFGDKAAAAAQMRRALVPGARVRWPPGAPMTRFRSSGSCAGWPSVTWAASPISGTALVTPAPSRPSCVMPDSTRYGRGSCPVPYASRMARRLCA